MRRLADIVDAVRRNEYAHVEELRYVVCAFDVLLAQLEVERNPEQLGKYMLAAESCPKEYIGNANDPGNPEVVRWHKAFVNVGKKELKENVDKI